MSGQKSRNIRSLVVVAVLLIISVSLSFLGSGNSDSLDIDRSKFVIENTIDITRISSTHKGKTTEIAFTGGRWMINGEFEADPTRIHLLFAAIQQAQVRRPVSREELPVLSDSMNRYGFKLSFGDGTRKLGQLETYGRETEGITWFRDADGIYLMEIPGYRAYIHGIIAVEADTWRNHNLFHRMRWNNLKGISVSFPQSKLDDLIIRPGENHLEISGINATDTTKLYDYIDHISLLNAVQYLKPDELPEVADVEIKVDVRDIGDRPYIMEILLQKSRDGNRIGRMDSSVYFTLPEESINPLMVGPGYFLKREGN